jgi:O-antigen/teichoic acid export membrane protein
MILIALSSIYSPLYASAFAKRNVKSLGKLFKQSQTFSLLGYLPIFLAFLLFGQWFLGLSGQEFKAGYLLLVILCLGQLVNAATGLSTHLNYMSHREAFETMTNIIMVIFLLIAGILCAYFYGVIGVAIATSAAVALKNILSYLQARRVIGGSVE